MTNFIHACCAAVYNFVYCLRIFDFEKSLKNYISADTRMFMHISVIIIECFST